MHPFLRTYSQEEVLGLGAWTHLAGVKMETSQALQRPGRRKTYQSDSGVLPEDPPGQAVLGPQVVNLGTRLVTPGNRKHQEASAGGVLVWSAWVRKLRSPKLGPPPGVAGAVRAPKEGGQERLRDLNWGPVYSTYGIGYRAVQPLWASVFGARVGEKICQMIPLNWLKGAFAGR